MSMHVVPLIFFNLGGEMLYVLDQRLRAQNIAQTKGKKVMGDLVTTMFKSKFTDQLMLPQTMYSRHAIRSMFDKIIKSSIMTIEEDSMDKLYDLMVMSFKYQVLQCLHPKDLIHITLNHFDTIMKFVPLKSDARSLVIEVHEKFVKKYSEISVGEFVIIRQMLLAFLQDAKNRVSVFINSNTQNSSGYFVSMTSGPIGKDSDLPGVIRYIAKDETETFHTGCNFSMPLLENEVNYEVGGKRATKLGCNLYANDCTLGHNVKQNSYQSSNQHLAKAELNLLAHLMGSDNKDNETKEFKLNLFNTTENTDIQTTSKKETPKPEMHSNVVTVSPSKSGNKALDKIMRDFTLNENSEKSADDDDLLALMDNA